MFAHRSQGSLSSELGSPILVDKAQVPSSGVGLKQSAAPGPLSAAADHVGPHAFAGTGGPSVGFSITTAATVGRIGGQIPVNTATWNAQQLPLITTLANGGFVVVWRDDSLGVGGATGDSDGAAIKAQVFAADGTMVGTEILVNTATAGSQYATQITALPGGGFVVTWTDESQGVGGATGDNSLNAVKAQVFTDAGVPVGTEILVNTVITFNQTAPQVTALSDGRFVVTWENQSEGGNLKAQIFTAAGAKVGAEILVNTATGGNHLDARITALSDGGFVVTWADSSVSGGDGSGYSIKAQVFAAGGARVGTEIAVNTATAGNQYAPQITELADGGFLVTWLDPSAGVGGATGDHSETAIKAQVFTAAGARVGTEILVNTATESQQTSPRITALADGGFVVTWWDDSRGVGGATGDNSGYAAKAQVFTAGGAMVGTEILVNTAINSFQYFNEITALSDGGFVVTWHDAGSSSVKAQVFTAAGAAIGDEILVNTVSFGSAPRIAALPNGGFAITWQGGNGTDGFGINAQIFSVGVAAVEQVPLNLQHIGFTISDPDAGDVLTVTLSADYGVLTLDPGELNIIVAGSGTATLTLTGTAGEIGRLFGDGVFADAPLLTFTADTDTPPASATITLTADDGAGGTATASTTISITDTFDVAPATAGDDTLTGSAADETIDGLDGDDILNGRGGDDILNGGAGSDTADYGSALTGVTVRLNLGSAPDDGEGGTDTLVSIENAIGSDFNDLLVGDGGVNVLTGGLGSDTLIGLAGNDILIGGAGAPNQMQGGLGDDLYVVSANDTLVEFAGEGIDTVQTDRASYVLKTHFENLTYTGAGNFRGVGNAGDNTIEGGSGDDVLIGGAGDDVLDGGVGIDAADYSAASGRVTASLFDGAASGDGDGGVDILIDIENLIGSAFDDNLEGDDLANALHGGDGDDVLSGRGGNDVLRGGAGLDTADYSAAAAGVRVKLSVGTTSNDGDGGADQLIDIENLTGSDFNDVLIGDGGANVLTGGLGADYLIGLAGNDTLVGGAGASNQLQGGLGDDLYIVTANDTLVEFAGEGIDTVQTTRTSYTLRDNLENLQFTGAGDFIGTGNAENNTLTGGGGNDVLTGGLGDDTLNGGLGDDVAVLSGLLADYGIEDLGGGQYRITDGVGGRDGIDLLNGVERVRFSDGSTALLTDLVSSAAPLLAEKDDGGPLVLPSLEDDGFLLSKDAGPQVLPGGGSDVFGWGDALILPNPGRYDFLALRLDRDPTPDLNEPWMMDLGHDQYF